MRVLETVASQPIIDKLSKESPEMNPFPKRSGHLAFLLSLSVLVLAGLIGPQAANAVDITACGQAIDSGTTNGQLTVDITWNGAGTCLQVSNGRNFNFNGRTITCQAGYTCGAAVTCATGDGMHVGSVIQAPNNDGDHTDVTGDFVVGIKNCGTVKNLKIVNAQTGILFDDASTNSQDVINNVIHSPDGGTGINIKQEDGGDVTSDNLVIGGAVGIFLAKGRNTTLGPQIKENILKSYSAAGIRSTITSNDYFRILRNSIIEGDAGSVPFDIAGSNLTYADNICEADPLATGHCACEMDRMDGTNADGCPL